MAIIENFLTKKDRKDMGNVSFYVCRGKYILRSKPLKTKRKRTPAEKINSMRLKKLVLLVKQILKYINAASPGKRQGKCAFRRFMSINLKKCFVKNTYTIEPSLLVLCDNEGSFVANVILNSTVKNKITGTFDSNAQIDDEGEDSVKAYGFDADNNKIWLFDQAAIRKTGTITLTHSEMSAMNIAVYFECLDRVNLLNDNPMHIIKYVGNVKVI